MEKQFPLSASKIDTYLGCRRLFKYRYLAPPPIAVPKSKHFVIGNLAHKALELFHRGNGAGELMTKSFREAYQLEGIPAHLDTMLLDRVDLLSVKEMLQKYLTWYRGHKQKDRIVSLEKYFTFELDGIPISGKADRVDLGKKHISIVDYKTNKQPYTKKDINESVQLQTYALWLRAKYQKARILPIKGKYLFLRHLDSTRGVKQFAVTQEMLDEAREKYNAVHKALTGNFDFKRNSMYKYCLTCEFRNYCFTDDNNDLKPKELRMAFVKTGDAPIQTVLCSCGGEIGKVDKKCKKCGKDFSEAKDGDRKVRSTHQQ